MAATQLSLGLLVSAAAIAVWATMLGDRGARGLSAPGVRSLKTLVPLLLLGSLLIGRLPAGSGLPLPVLLIAIGLAATAVADWLLAPVDNEATFVPGLAAFLCGYALYGAALHTWWYGAIRATAASPRTVLPLAVAAAVALIGYLQLRRLSSVPPALRAPVVLYLIVVSNLLAAAVLLALSVPGPVAVVAAAGALSIYVSDSLIAHNLFHRRLPREELWIMPSYYLGQLLLTVAFLAF